MSLFADVTFMEISLTLITLAVAERLMVRYLPDSLVGPEGLLLRTNAD